MDMVHLRPEARDLALLPATERLARMPANRWISYTRASQAIALLGRMLEREPGCSATIWMGSALPRLRCSLGLTCCLI